MSVVLPAYRGFSCIGGFLRPPQTSTKLSLFELYCTCTLLIHVLYHRFVDSFDINRAQNSVPSVPILMILSFFKGES